MRQRPRSWLQLPALLGLLLAPATAGAQEFYTFTAGVLGGAGGSIDADPGNDVGNLGLQLNLSVLTEPKTYVGFRLGLLDLDVDETFEGLDDAELTYANVAGEYRFEHGYYESGLFAGLGVYRLEGRRIAGGADADDTSFGVALGITGEFDLTRRLGLLIELSGHWADLDAAQLYLLGHVGVTYRF